jgi:membrane-bound lytic murein transglycosylase F
MEERTISTPRLRTLVLLLLSGIAGQSCSPDAEAVRIVDPVERDWSDIQQDGVLRMITRYNSSSYFIHRGVERGFDYELLREFARSENLVLEVVIQREGENLIDHLNRGDGDVIAAHYVITDARSELVTFTTPYEKAPERVIATALVAPALTSLEKLSGMTFHVRKGSSGEAALKELQQKGISINIVTVGDDWDSEALMLAINNGEIEATVCDENLFKAASGYMDNIAAGPVLKETSEIALAVRTTSGELQQRLDRFLAQHLREDPATGKQKRSAFFSSLVKRYYEDQKQISTFKQPLKESKWAGTLSPYDKLVQPIAAEYNIDWRLVVAMMAQESLFNEQAKSWAGAVGLMQVMPKSSKYTEAELLNPETNIREGLRILVEAQQAFTYLAEPERLAFALAAYNAGIGHVNDARRIAIDQRKNPNNWEDVADGFLKLMNPVFYENARYGFCRGIETVRYVREIQNRYQMYVTVMDLAENNVETGFKPVLGFMQPLR